MSFTAEKKSFVKDGRPYFLKSGEIHYFRVKPSLWEKHLKALKKAGANCASTYICWDFHEYEKGRFDLTGETDPARDIAGFIKLCRKTGLDLIVKPGPYILAEYDGCGIPLWLLEEFGKKAKKKKVSPMALDENGAVIAPDIITYMSEEFLDFTFKWYDKIMPIIAENQHSAGGPVIMLQVCNEIGLFQWLSGKTDYNLPVLKLYDEFIRNKYGSIDKLNRVYGTKYNDFSGVQPPRGVITSRKEYAAYYDFHIFFREYFARYFQVLTDRIRSYGIDVQFTHNIPGWIYGQASELPMLISTYSEVMEKRKDITFGLDHIPEYMSFRNAHCDLACNRILEAVQGESPVWSAEFQAGSREHHVKNDPADMELFYLSSVAHGLKGFNFYMFSRGINPKERGFSGKYFYYQTALDYDGKPLALYDTVKKALNLIKKEEQELLFSEEKPQAGIGLYKPYYYTELISSQLMSQKRLLVDKLGLYIDPKFLRETVFFDGILRSMQTLNINYRIEDLVTMSAEELLRERQLWVISAEYMDAKTQGKLADYAESGGHLVIYPAIPVLDEYLNPCTVLRDRLGIRFTAEDCPNKINILGIEEVNTYLSKKQLYEKNPGSNIIATVRDGRACGIEQKTKKGKVTAIGAAFGYTMEEHLKIYQSVLKSDGIEPEIKISDPDIQYVLRRGEKKSYLFLLNYHNRKKVFNIGKKTIRMSPLSCRVIIRNRL